MVRLQFLLLALVADWLPLKARQAARSDRDSADYYAALQKVENLKAYNYL